MSKIRVLILAGIVAWSGLGIAMAVDRTTTEQTKAEQYPPGYNYTCPEGSYPIGDGVCKAEPTGCPFGDSVPMDKCAPPPDIECNADWSECHPKKTGTAEKQEAIAEHSKPFEGGSSCTSK